MQILSFLSVLRQLVFLILLPLCSVCLFCFGFFLFLVEEGGGGGGGGGVSWVAAVFFNKFMHRDHPLHILLPRYKESSARPNIKHSKLIVFLTTYHDETVFEQT